MFAGDVFVEPKPSDHRRVAVDAQLDVVLRHGVGFIGLCVVLGLGVDVDSVDAVFDRVKIRGRAKLDLTPADDNFLFQLPLIPSELTIKYLQVCIEIYISVFKV